MSIANAKPIENPRFYIVTKNGKTSYILGTVHFGFSLQDLPKIVQNSLNKSSTLIVESYESKETIDAILNGLPDVEDIGITSTEDSNALNAKEKNILVQAWGISPKHLNIFKRDSGCSWLLYYDFFVNHKILDYQIIQTAYNQNKRIIGLDTQELIASAEDESHSQDQSEECSVGNIINTYATRALVQHLKHQLFANGISNYDNGLEGNESSDPLVYVRNQAWLPTLTKELSKGSVFIAVGYGHLYKEKGLLSLLKAQGFTIKKVK